MVIPAVPCRQHDNSCQQSGRLVAARNYKVAMKLTFIMICSQTAVQSEFRNQIYAYENAKK